MCRVFLPKRSSAWSSQYGTAPYTKVYRRPNTRAISSFQTMNFPDRICPLTNTSWRIRTLTESDTCCTGTTLWIWSPAKIPTSMKYTKCGNTRSYPNTLIWAPASISSQIAQMTQTEMGMSLTACPTSLGTGTETAAPSHRHLHICLWPSAPTVPGITWRT